MNAVRNVIVGLSGPSGPIKSYTLSFDTARQTVSCFLEMRSPMLESEIRELNACGFGNSLCVDFPSGRDSAGAT